MVSRSPRKLIWLLAGIVLLSTGIRGRESYLDGSISDVLITGKGEEEVIPSLSRNSEIPDLVFAKSTTADVESKISKLDKDITKAELDSRYGRGSVLPTKASSTAGIPPDRNVGSNKANSAASNAGSASSKASQSSIKNQNPDQPTSGSSAKPAATKEASPAKIDPAAASSSSKQTKSTAKPIKVRKGRRKNPQGQGSPDPVSQASTATSKPSGDQKSTKSSSSSTRSTSSAKPSRSKCRRCIIKLGKKAALKYFKSTVQPTYKTAVMTQCSVVPKDPPAARQGCIQQWKHHSLTDPWTHPLSYCEDQCRGVEISKLKLKKINFKFPKVKLQNPDKAQKSMAKSASSSKYVVEPIPKSTTSMSPTLPSQQSSARPTVPDRTLSSSQSTQPSSTTSQNQNYNSNYNNDNYGDDDDDQSGPGQSQSTSRNSFAADDDDQSNVGAYRDAVGGMDDGTRANICQACVNWMFDSTKELRANFHREVCKCEGNCFVPDNWWVLLKAPCKAILAASTFVASRAVGLTGAFGGCSVVCAGMVIKDPVTGRPIGS